MGGGPEHADAPHHPIGDAREGCGQPMAGPQDHRLRRRLLPRPPPGRPHGCREGLPALGQEPRVGPAEGLHGGVRITEQDDTWPTPHTAARDDAKQSGRRGGHLLGVVDDDEIDSLVEPVESPGLVLEPVGDRGEDPRGS